MTQHAEHWSKEELVVYLLIFCALVDNEESQQEYDYIRTKTDSDTFEKMYREIQNDSEDEALQKIADNIHNHEFSHGELVDLRKELHEVFFADGKFQRMEESMVRILDNIIY